MVSEAHVVAGPFKRARERTGSAPRHAEHDHADDPALGLVSIGIPACIVNHQRA
jgi:hypothetical protein